jgi:hypothetical protein
VFADRSVRPPVVINARLSAAWVAS